MYFNGLFNLDQWDDSAEYAIFDDWDDWSKWYSYKCWIGAQNEFTVTDKYKKKQSIRWGKPSIILSNDDPNFKDNAWVARNAIFYNIRPGEKFF